MTPDRNFQQAQNAHQAGNIAEAEDLYRTILNEAPGHLPALRFLGILLLERGEATEAESIFSRALALAPAEPTFHQNRAMALSAQGNAAGALAALDRAIALKPDYARAFFNRGEMLISLSRFEEAVRSFQRALTLGYSDAALFFAMGHSFTELDMLDQALACYQRAVELRPDFLQTISNGAVLLHKMRRHDEALAWSDRALALDPESPQSHNNRAIVLRELGRPSEAIPHFRKAMAATPDLPYLRGGYLFAVQHVCDWRDYDKQCTELLTALEQRHIPVSPFELLSMPSTPAQQKLCAEIHAADKFPYRPMLAPRKPRPPGRLRIAYLGTCFNTHVVAILTAAMLERHDRANFEIFGVAYGFNDNTLWRKRMIAACEHFLDVNTLNDRQVAQRLRDWNIDIAVDLDGYTTHSRPGIFSLKPVPIQVNFLGYPGTMGNAAYDYLIGDSIITPPDQQMYYCEKLVQMPDTYQPNSARPEGKAVTRAEAGLPETGFVFGCFNHAYKITPATFDSWMRILSRVPGSHLWLLGNEPREMVDNLRKEAEARGVDPGRLVFAPKTDLDSHMARLKLMDLFLDTFVYGAHTTASDALWSAVPLVTKLGEAFPARVAASLLTNIGLPELVTRSAEEFENLAVTLAGDPARMARLKQHLRDVRDTTPMFDAGSFARHLESAYRTMADKRAAGEAPEGFAVTQ